MLPDANGRDIQRHPALPDLVCRLGIDPAVACRIENRTMECPAAAGIRVLRILKHWAMAGSCIVTHQGVSGDVGGGKGNDGAGEVVLRV
jgi:hypothetical protein